MYIEFRLPNGAGGMAAGHACSVLRKKIAQWAEKNGNPNYKAGVEGAYRFRFMSAEQRISEKSQDWALGALLRQL